MSPEPPDSAVFLRKAETLSCPLIISSPHSGTAYPPDFLAASTLPPHELQRMEDRFVDRFFESAGAEGGALLSARFPRAWCDVNRDPRELDPRMFAPPLAAADVLETEKVRAGFGVIPRHAGGGRSIYAAPVPGHEIARRLDAAWRPYHAALTALLEEAQGGFGSAVLLDAHSMPRLPWSRACDFVLGDANGASCAGAVTGFVEDFLSARGYAVRRNVPYSGGFITRRHGRPKEGVHALQIEICRSLYLDPHTLAPSRGFVPLQRDMAALTRALAVFAREFAAVPA